MTVQEQHINVLVDGPAFDRYVAEIVRAGQNLGTLGVATVQAPCDGIITSVHWSNIQELVELTLQRTF